MTPDNIQVQSEGGAASSRGKSPGIAQKKSKKSKQSSKKGGKKGGVSARDAEMYDEVVNRMWGSDE